MNSILTILRKEVRENLRDKRTLTSALLYGPLIGPVIFVLMMNLVINKQIEKAEAPLKLPVIGASHAPNLVDFLRQQGLEPQPPVADPIAAVRDRDADAVLKIPAGYGKAWRKGEPAQVELYFDSSQTDSSAPVRRISRMLDAWGHQNGAMRLIARGLSPSLVQPLHVDQRDQSTPQSRAANLFAILPYFFVLTVFLGGMYLAIDLTAGERERQSLEPLFANPVARWRILLGKIGAISAFSLVSLVISIIAFAIAGHFIPTDKLGMVLKLDAMFAVQVLLLMAPLVALLAVLQTLVSAFAKSYREAQTYLGILMLVPALPSIVLSVSPVKTSQWMYAVPLLAQQVGITDLLRGSAVGGTDIGIALVTGFAAALLVGLVTAQVYRSERLAISA